MFLEEISAVRYDFLAVNNASNSMNYDERVTERMLDKQLEARPEGIRKRLNL